MLREVIVERVGHLMRLRLNRPEAINALTHGMIRAIGAALDVAETDPLISVVLLTGEGERGLCAGGDIRSLYEAPPEDRSGSLSFWRDEYRLDARIARMEKPFVAFMDGVVMGGGVGISAHARHRIVTERSKIALPECAIGFVPDVGATWLLPRAPGQLGTWIGLTGRSLGPADAILAGLADWFLPAARLTDLVDALAVLQVGADHDDVSHLLQRLSSDPAPASLDGERHLIDRAFAHKDVASIVAALAGEPGDFAQRTAADLAAKSPTALKLALRLCRLGRDVSSLEEALELEFAACRALVLGHDFYEGIRAQIIDRDRQPKWRPAQLADVSDDWVEQVLRVTEDRVFPEQGGKT